MLETIIFDLSEVFVAGMHGIEKPLARILKIPEHTVLPLMSGPRVRRLFIGEITEEKYLRELREQEQWDISLERLKKVIRDNFHSTVPGMDANLLQCLAGTYRLVILSDHAREWVEYLQPVHQSLLSGFTQLFFSFDPRLRGTKKEVATFHKVLNIIGDEPEECLFIDDRERNVRVAAEVGIPGIVFTDAQRLINVEFPQFGITLNQ